MNKIADVTLSKVPEVTLTFWLIKIAATTLGETGGDSVTMTLHWGYLDGTALFLAALVVLVVVQTVAQEVSSLYLLGHHHRLHDLRHHHGRFRGPFARHRLRRRLDDPAALPRRRARAYGIGRVGSISVDTVNTPKVEAFYWAAITFSQTLGTALGDWTANSTGLGYEYGALVFAAGLAVVAAAYYRTNVSRVLLFWAAFILTRPLGATVGDFLDKPVSHGGLALSRPIASAVIAAFILACLLILPQRAGQHPVQVKTAA